MRAADRGAGATVQVVDLAQQLMLITLADKGQTVLRAYQQITGAGPAADISWFSACASSLLPGLIVAPCAVCAP